MSKYPIEALLRPPVEFYPAAASTLSALMLALGRKPNYEQITRYGTDIEPLLVDYYEYWLENKREAIGWREHTARIEATLSASGGKGIPKNMAGRGHYAQALIQYVKDNNFYDPIANALGMTMGYEKSYFDKLVASLLPLMEKLTTGKIADLISPDYEDMDDERPIFDWQSVINNAGIVYVGLDALSDAEVAGAIGNSMFADLTSVAGQIYKYGQSFGLPVKTKPRKIAIHADEFNELIGDEFIPLLNKAGGAGFQVTAYTQTWSDVEAKIGSPAKAGQIGGNFNTLVMLRVKNVETAEILTNQLPEVRLISVMAASSANDTSDPTDFADFASKNEDRVSTETAPTLAPSDMVQLPKGQAFALIEGGQLYKIRMPLADPGHDPMMPDGLEKIAKDMEVRYRASSPGEKWADLWWTKSLQESASSQQQPEEATA
jgi:conjugative coupling factor TraD (SXT/TOL subfamily)